MASSPRWSCVTRWCKLFSALTPSRANEHLSRVKSMAGDLCILLVTLLTIALSILLVCEGLIHYK